MKYRAVRIVASVCGMCALVGLVSRATGASAPQTSKSPTVTPGGVQTVTATVRSVDESARTVDLLTGVGHALRVVRVSAAENCQIRVKAAAAGLRDIKPGVICRVQFRKIAARNVAERIEVQGAAAHP